jgi:hypothetical protein
MYIGPMGVRGVAEQVLLWRERPALGTKTISILLFLAEGIALCLPAIANGSPLLFPDSRAYYLGGRAAIDKIEALFSTQVGGAEALATTVQKARGVRSVFYSLFTYIPADTVSLWLVIVFQAIIVASLLRLAFRLACPGRERWQGTIFTIVLSLLTTVSWTTSNVMPDIFTSIMSLGLILTIVYWPQIGRWARVWVFISIAGSMVMHLTNLPIAFGLLVIAAGLTRRRVWYERERYMVIGGALLMGIVAMLAVSVVGFKQWTLAPQSPPFLLARSIEDGPAKLYLLDHCPQIDLVMCHHLDKLDQGTEIFIWDKNGVYSAVPPEEAAQLRAEDKRIFVAAALEHPWLQGKAMVRNAAVQLIAFTLHEYYIPSWAAYTPTDMTLHMPDQAPWQTILSIPEYIVVIAGLGFIVHAWRKGFLTQDRMYFIVLVIATVLLEALAGAVSEPAPRYEARVIWLIPMVAMLSHINRRRRQA